MREKIDREARRSNAQCRNDSRCRRAVAAARNDFVIVVIVMDAYYLTTSNISYLSRDDHDSDDGLPGGTYAMYDTIPLYTIVCLYKVCMYVDAFLMRSTENKEEWVPPSAL